MYPKARLRELPEHSLMRKIDYFSQLIPEFLPNDKLVLDWAELYRRHRRLLTILEGVAIQKAIDKFQGVYVWWPKATQTQEYNAYNLFFAHVNADVLTPEEIQGHFGYFYAFYLIEELQRTSITETRLDTLLFFTMDYYSLFEYVKTSLEVIESWFLGNFEEIKKFLTGDIATVPDTTKAQQTLKEAFVRFQDQAKFSKFQRWNYLASIYDSTKSFYDVLDYIPRGKLLKDIAGKISADYRSFPKHLYSAKRLPSSPKMLFDLQQPAEVSKNYFIEQYNATPKPTSTLFNQFLSIKLKPIEKTLAVQKYITEIQKTFSIIDTIQPISYNETIYEMLNEFKEDIHIRLLEIDKNLRDYYKEILEDSDNPINTFKETGRYLIQASLFALFEIQTNPPVWDDVSEYQEFLEELTTTTSMLLKLKEAIKPVPLLPLPQWNEVDYLQSLEWLVTENAEMLLDLELPSFLNHALYHAFTSFQKNFWELIRAYDVLETFKKTFNEKWWITRQQILDYLRYVVHLQKSRKLPDELMFSDFETFEDFISGEAEIAEAEKIKDYINVQVPVINQEIQRLNQQISEKIQQIIQLVEKVMKIPRPQADFQKSLEKFKEYSQQVGLKQIFKQLDKHLTELGELLLEAGEYWEAYYEFVFTRNFHLIISWYTDDLYDFFEAVPHLKWQPVLPNISYDTLLEWMKTSPLAFVLGIKHLHANLEALLQQTAESFSDAWQTFKTFLNTKRWPIALLKLPNILNIDVDALWILPDIDEYQILKAVTKL